MPPPITSAAPFDDGKIRIVAFSNNNIDWYKIYLQVRFSVFHTRTLRTHLFCPGIRQVSLPLARIDQFQGGRQ